MMITSLLILASLVSPASPFLSMRLRANDTESVETWRANFREVVAHPGCCDEIWFSTGCGAPALDWHRKNAAVLAEAVKDCRAKGIAPSLQFQATLGHGDFVGTPELFDAGWICVACGFSCDWCGYYPRGAVRDF